MRDTLLIINTILSFPTLPFLRNKQHKTQNFCYVSLFQRPRFVAYFIGGSCFDFDLSFWSEVVRVGMGKGWLDLWFMIKTCQSGWNEKKGVASWVSFVLLCWSRIFSLEGIPSLLFPFIHYMLKCTSNLYKSHMN